jgi:hypothetical protein
MRDFQNEENEPKITPVIEGFRCKTMVYAVYFGLSLLPIFAGAYVWLFHDWLIAIGVVLFLYIASSIVISKIRLSSLPPQLREYSLSSFEVAKWYVHQHHCF